MDEENKKHCLWKYLGLFLATLIGAFLAVYFVTDIAINRLMNPFVMMDKMEHEFEKMDNDMLIPPHHMRGHFRAGMMKAGAVDFIRTPDEYKFIVDLKPFSGNEKDINITADQSNITISGEAKSDKKHMETFTSFSQTYILDDDVNFSKMTRKKVHDKYIITVPLEDKD